VYPTLVSSFAPTDTFEGAPGYSGRHMAAKGSGARTGNGLRPAKSKQTRTRRGDATRQTILDAALGLFSAKGYHQTTVPDIVKAAGVGHGTFYEYFTSRRDVLIALTAIATTNLAGGRRLATPVSAAERIRHEILWYLGDHIDNLELTKIWTEAERFDPDIAQARRRHHDLRIERIRRAIELANPPGIDPAIGAVALYSMLESFVYRWYIDRSAGTKPSQVIEVADTLAALWINAIGLSSTPPSLGEVSA
jgi:AcrR family transcriptional regulator